MAIRFRLSVLCFVDVGTSTGIWAEPCSEARIIIGNWVPSLLAGVSVSEDFLLEAFGGAFGSEGSEGNGTDD